MGEECVKKHSLLKIINYIKSILYKKATIIFVAKALDNIDTVEPRDIDITYRFVDKINAYQIATADYLSSTHAHALFNKNAKCLGAFKDDMLVGYVWFQCMPTHYPFFNYNFDYKKDAYVGPDYVSPPYRGKRIHRALLSYMFKYLQNQGYNTAWTSVWLNNTPSIRGLMAVGYEPRFQITAVRVFKRLVYKKIKTRDSW
jgi:GNAT superfamily N-acetyltransferase